MAVTKPTIGQSNWAPVNNAALDYLDAQDATKADASTVTAHTGSTANPHSVTKTQVGLANVDNTSDANKPVSTAQAAADALKATLPVASPTDAVSLYSQTTGGVAGWTTAHVLVARALGWSVVTDATFAGGVGTGRTEAQNTAAITAAITALGASGGTIWFPQGTYSGTITATAGISIKGASYKSTILQSATTDVVTISGYGYEVSGINFKSTAGGGHCVVVPPGLTLSQSQFSMVEFQQQNDAKSCFKYTSVSSTGGGIFDVHWLDCYFLHLSTSTVPAFDVYGDNNVFSANKFTRTRAQLCGTAAFFYIAADGAAGEANYNNVWDTINFESTNGGGIKAMSATDWGIYNPGFYDMGTITGDLISFGRLTGSPVRPQSRGMNIYNYHRSGGTLSSAKDVNLIAGGCTGTANIYGIGGPNAAGILVDLGSAVGYATVIGYDPTNVGIQNASSSSTLITGQLGIQTGSITLKPATGSLLPTVGACVGTPEAVVTAAIGSIRQRVDGVPGTTLYVKTSGAGNTGWSPQRGTITSTTAALAAIGNAINTAGKGTGDMVFNTTTSKTVWSTGTTAGSVWVDATGATAHTPV